MEGHILHLHIGLFFCRIFNRNTYIEEIKKLFSPLSRNLVKVIYIMKVTSKVIVILPIGNLSTPYPHTLSDQQYVRKSQSSGSRSWLFRTRGYLLPVYKNHMLCISHSTLFYPDVQFNSLLFEWNASRASERLVLL
jgi:hypothetical protein